MVKKFLFLVMLLCTVPLSTFATDSNDYWNMFIDGKSMIEPGPHSYTFGVNPYHSRYTVSDIQLPFKEVITLPVGPTAAQPVILGNHILLMCGDGIKVISLKEKRVVQSVRLQFYNTTDPNDYDVLTHQLKASNSQITHIPNQTGWWHTDKVDRILCGTRDGLLYCFKFSKGQLEKEWCFELAKGMRFRSTPMFFFDQKVHTPYLVASSLNQTVYILDKSGNLLKSFKEQGQITSSPMIYRNIRGSYDFDRFIIGVDGGYGKNTGYLSSYFALLGDFHSSRTFNQEKSQKFNFSGIPASMASKDTGDDILIFFSDKEGHLYCFSEKTGDLLWQINRYAQQGTLTINNTPSVDDCYVYFTLTNYKGKAHLVAVDYIKAQKLAESQQNPKSSLIENAIVMEGGDYTGITYSGTSIVELLKKKSDGSKTVQRVLVTSNITPLNTNKESSSSGNSDPNLFIYHAQKQDKKDFVPVIDAFLTKNKNGSIQLSSNLTLPGGVLSEPTVTDNHLMVVDGLGILHVFTSAFEKNLAVTSLKTDTVPLVKGKRHLLTAVIKNFGDEPLQSDIDLTANGQTKHFEDLVIPINGLSLPMELTLPPEFTAKEITVSCSIDPQQQLATETDRSDNFMSAQIPVQAPVDISISLPVKSYATNKWVTTTVSVSNTSPLPLKNIPLSVFVDDVAIEENTMLQLPAHSKLDVPIKWLTPNKLGKVTLKACVDVSPETTNTVEEEYEANNRATAVCPIVSPHIDLAVTGYTTTKVLENTWVIHTIKVTNYSDQSFIGNNRVNVTFKTGSEFLSTVTELAASETRLIPFICKSPPAPHGQLTCHFTATINTDRKIMEYAPTGDVWANNTLQGTFNVIPLKTGSDIIANPESYKPITPPAGCEKPTVHWIESRFDHTETRIVGYDTDSYDVEVTHADGSTSTSTRTRRTPIYQTFDIFKDWHFMTHLTLSCDVTPPKVKSGYGFELNCTTKTDTNYDHLERITGAQRVYAYFPEDQYTTPLNLVSKYDPKTHTNTWTLPVNSHSVLNKNNHYVPVWFPNGTYTIKLVATDQNSPGGSACTTRFITLDIVGNMYEDDFTTSIKN